VRKKKKKGEIVTRLYKKHEKIYIYYSLTSDATRTPLERRVTSVAGALSTYEGKSLEAGAATAAKPRLDALTACIKRKDD
jgi:hypothetical protein